MRKATGIIVVLICLSIYYISSDELLTNNIISLKLTANTSPFRSDRFRFGDLYGMSNLPAFRNKIPVRHFDSADCNLPRKMNLYAFCDSYVWSFLDSAKYYCGVDSLTYSRVNNHETFRVKPDTGKRNVLLIAFVERNIRVVLNDSPYIDNVLGFKTGNDPAVNPVQVEKRSARKFLTDLKSEVVPKLFNKQINSNIQSNLWDYSFLHSIKEAKASLNYALFKSTDKEVKVATAGDQLFYAQTVDTSYKKLSAFNAVSDEEITQIVEKFNALQRQAKLAGFDNVCISLLPNPVSMIEPGYLGLRYNRLVERIQRHPELQSDFVDLLPSLSRLKSKAYYSSDTHWNVLGVSVWLKMFNERLARYSSEKK